MRFKIIDHPSDVGIIAYGGTREEIFENAAYGLFSLMADMEKVSPKETIKITVKAQDPESLLVNWLNELIFNEDAKKMLFKEFKIEELTDTRLKAVAAGEKINLNLHSLFRSVKAATYNQLRIGPGQAKIVFDV
ncbi:archease [Candidatus Saganbacteria bacterium]|uniref:Archease n=1 Tax=Candidatus Saganbacteria bacterium TaxID=2575572 RepID=A0A9D6UKD2_UNCSA|nr:archease [Candidatus Saganbacteria bacterium]